MMSLSYFIENNLYAADSLLKIFESSGIGHYTGIRFLKERINIKMSVSEGHMAPDFTPPDTAGKVFRLSSLRGKYVLLDFWASWCGPCRHENPNLVSVYNNFKDNNFAIVSVSFDEKRADWLKAIQDDGLAWTNIGDLKGQQNAVGTLYGVNGIPANYLIDPGGRIIKINLMKMN